MDAALIACRFLHYGSAILLFGIGAFQGYLAPKDLARSLDAALWRVVVIAALVALLTAVAWLLLASGEMGEGWNDVWSPATWHAVLSDTEFGRVWQFRLLLAGVVAALLMVRGSFGWRLMGGLSALLLGSLGLVGHAAMLEGAGGWVNRISHVVHLLAGGFWVGALVPLMLCLGKFADRDLKSQISSALRRFSGLGHISVAAVVATGVINTALVLGRWPGDLSSPYQSLLVMKVSLVAVMAGLAIVNRYLLVPKIGNSDQAMLALRLFTLAELMLGTCALGLVSLLGTIQPQ